VPEGNGFVLIERDLAGRLLERVLAHGGDFAEVYAEERTGLSLSLDDRKLERAQSGFEAGAAIRVVAGGSTYFGHVDGLAESDLERLADDVGAVSIHI
jgi:TldD protein